MTATDHLLDEVCTGLETEKDTYPLIRRTTRDHFYEEAFYRLEEENRVLAERNRKLSRRVVELERGNG